MKERGGQMNKALFRVVIGFEDEEATHDCWGERFVIAETATDAIGRIKAARGEYIAQVILVGRATP